MRPNRFCQRHQQPRPCPECGAVGYGGTREGSGRKPTIAAPVRVFVTLEQAELDQALKRWPGMSRSQALRHAVLEALHPVVTREAREGAVLIHDTRIKKGPALGDGGEALAVEDVRTVAYTFYQCWAIHDAAHELRTLGGEKVHADNAEHALGKIPRRQTLMDRGYPHTRDDPSPGLQPPWKGGLTLKDCRQIQALIRRALKVADARVDRRYKSALRSYKEARKRPKRARPLPKTPEQIRGESEKYVRGVNGHLRRALKATLLCS